VNTKNEIKQAFLTLYIALLIEKAKEDADDKIEKLTKISEALINLEKEREEVKQ